MVEVPLYDGRFRFGRLVSDCGRVVLRQGPTLAVGILALGVAPVTIAALPWWSSSLPIEADAYRRIWVIVNTAKSLVQLVALATLSLFVAVLSLKVLTEAAWSVVLQARRLACGFGAVLAVSLAGNGPALATPVVLAEWRSVYARGLLSWAELAAFLLSIATLGVTVSVALAEAADPLSAIARGFRLLRGLRWRVVSLGVAYLIVSGVCTAATALTLPQLGLSGRGPGLGLALARMPTVLLGALAQIVFVSIFLQARRIADGPSAVELHEVFA